MSASCSQCLQLMIAKKFSYSFHWKKVINVAFLLTLGIILNACNIIMGTEACLNLLLCFMWHQLLILYYSVLLECLICYVLIFCTFGITAVWLSDIKLFTLFFTLLYFTYMQFPSFQLLLSAMLAMYLHMNIMIISGACPNFCLCICLVV